jgi:hypothetical protein
MIRDDSAIHNVAVNHRALGLCWVVYGLIHLAVAVWLAVHSATATLMFGALLNRVPDPFTMMDLFHIAYLALIVGASLGGALGFLAGLALLSGQQMARMLAIVAAFLCLPCIPLGTCLGTYTLIILLAKDARQTTNAVSSAQTSSLKHQQTTP